jgi:FkbM family methyltransferase
VGSLLAHRDDEVITANLVRWGVWEAEETRFVRAALRPDDTFVAVGANIGYFSVLAASCVGTSGNVIAIEPEPRNLQLLHLNLARNGARSNATVLPVAAYSRAGRMVLTTNEANRGDHRLAPHASTGLQVRCVRLDDVLPRSVDAIKIDTQGFDHDVIAGLSRTISANPALVVLTELSLTKIEKRGLNVDDVLAGYLERGFGIEILDRSGTPSRSPPKTWCAAATRLGVTRYRSSCDASTSKMATKMARSCLDSRPP